MTAATRRLLGAMALAAGFLAPVPVAAAPTSSDRAPGSERLTDYPREYEWSIVTDFNVEQVRHRGSGIFLHVNGRGATAGCVSAPRRFIRALVRRLDTARVPVIGIGR